MNNINKIILASLFCSMSAMFSMREQEYLTGTLLLKDDWLDLSVQEGKKLGCEGSEGLPEKVYKFITKEHLSKDTIVYLPMLEFTLGAEKGNGQNIMAFLSCMKVLKKDHPAGAFPRLVAHKILCFMLPDQINETIIIKNPKLSGLMKEVNGERKHKKDLDINGVFAVIKVKGNCKFTENVKLIAL